MKTPQRHRLLTALALGALLATGFGASAEPARKQDNDRSEVRKDKREHRQEQRKEHREDRREAKQERREDRIDHRQDRREDKQERREDHREVRQERHEDRQQVRARIARQQQVQRIRARQAARHRAYSRGYGYAPVYRYSYGGRWHDTSRYGANMLRSAIQRGYQEGLRAGRSDRYNRWGDDYRRSRVWVDASFGYGGSYVSRNDYSHYFRQGFQRGYDDGYYGRGRYGRHVNGEAVIIQAVLEAILGLQRLG